MDSFKYQIKKSADRAQFEADKLRRLQKVRADADQVKREIKHETVALGQKALEIARAGAMLPPVLQEIVDKVYSLEAGAKSLRDQMEAIRAEVWVPPAPPPPPLAATPAAPAGVLSAETPRASRAEHEPADRVSARLRFYIEEEETNTQCPNCRVLVDPGMTVCANCGFRLKAD
jgi:hypothetical protein